MGSSSSRSSPPTETVPVRIHEYSKLMRAPVRSPPILDTIRLDELRWEITVTPRDLNGETGVCDALIVAVFLGAEHSPESALGIDMSIEILDHTGLYTVFHRESRRVTMKEAGGYLLLHVWRRELEASLCIRRRDDSFLVRCTVKEQRRPSLLQNWFSSKFKKQTPISAVAMTRSHTLTLDSLSQVKASLLSCECVYSTRFAVGGSRWYLKLYPSLAAVRLARATKEDDETRTRAEFSFALEGAVNVQSGIMTHTFDRDSPDCVFEYQPLEEMNTSSTDRLVVRCFVKVIPAVVPTAVPPVTIPATVPRAVINTATAIPADVRPPGESVLTPLLSAMHG